MQLIDPEAAPAWRALVDPWCMYCGASAAEWPGLSVHHIIRRSIVRYDHPANFLLLCEKRCHPLAEGLTVREHGIVVPNLKVGNCLWLKRKHDLIHVDDELLTQLVSPGPLEDVEEP